MPEEVLHRGLSRLQTAEFLYETRLFPDPENTFTHALTHEVAYGGSPAGAPPRDMTFGLRQAEAALVQTG